MNIKNNYIFFIKVIISISLLYFLWTKKVIDIDLISYVFTSVWIIPLFLLMLINSFFIVIRWRLLLNPFYKGAPLFYLFKLHAIGLFFNFCLPSSIGGDFVKAYYLSKNKDLQKKAVLSIFVGRILGLLAICFLASVFLLFRPFPTEYQTGFYLILAALFGIQLIFIIGFIMFNPIHDASEKMLERIKINFLGALVKAILSYKNHRKSLFYGFVISVVINLIYVFFYYLYAIYLQKEVYSFHELAAIIPLGAFLSIIPLTPGGVGVTQWGYYFLYDWLLGIKSTFGANSSSIFQTLQFLIGILGLYYYLIHYTQRKYVRSKNQNTSK